MSTGEKYNLEFESLFMTQDWVAKIDKLKSNSVWKKCNLYKIVVLKAFLSETSSIARIK